jgi:undecaprenyl-diphosphatase
MARDWLASVARRRTVGTSRLAWAVLFGTIPAGVVGLLARAPIETLRSPLVVACTTIGFGGLLWLADRRKGARTEHDVGWRDVLVIGCAQALALVPGTSRSGVTITAGLFSGLTREAAARFSFLLAGPVMTAAGLSELVHFASADVVVDTYALVLGTLVSAVTGFAVIHFFLRWLTRYGVLPYVLYRLALGTVLFGVIILSQ